MAPLAQLPEIVGFFSYSREDDEAFRGSLSAPRDAIQRELGAQLGRTRRNFRLWQDQEAIAPGKLWESQIAKAVEEAVFFIPIITPRAVASKYCNFEFKSFLARERALGRNDLVFPIHYILVPALLDEAKWRDDQVLSIIGKRQYVDWRDYRHDPVDTPAFRKAIDRFCGKIAETLRERWISPEDRRHLEEEAKRRVEDEERVRQEAEAKRQAEERERLRKEALAKQRAQEEARKREEAKRQRETPAPTTVTAPAPAREKEESHALANVRRLTAAQERAFKAAQERALKAGDSFKEGADCPEMIVVPAGRFLMGAPAGQGFVRFLVGSPEHPQHEVTIAKPFAVAKFALTFDEWDACAAHGGCRSDVSDSEWGRGRRPVINLSWDDTQAYVKWLSSITGKAYRLLSEAEYEYAARAGSQTKYPWGHDITLNGKPMANCASCGSQWDGKQTAPVGSFAANAFGLYDMVGNVFEWTEDCWNPNYKGAPADGSAWTSGDCSRRVVRGGSWGFNSDFLRSALRSWITTGDWSRYLGFRVARTLIP
jgi:formylglycine-generating enzyme required for sulfatase activity